MQVYRSGLDQSGWEWIVHRGILAKRDGNGVRWAGRKLENKLRNTHKLQLQPTPEAANCLYFVKSEDGLPVFYDYSTSSYFGQEREDIYQPE